MEPKRGCLPGTPIDVLVSPQRREFLRVTAGGALAAAGVAGCGGGATGADSAGSGGSATEQRQASMQAIQDYVNALPDQDHESWRASVLAFVQSQPGILGAGRHIDGVWVVFADGVPLTILDNRRPEDVASAAAVERERKEAVGSNVPAWGRARLINTLGNLFSDDTLYVGPLLQSAAYQVTIDKGDFASLKQVQEDGVFYISAHGGLCVTPVLDANGQPILGGDGKPIWVERYGLWTSESWTIPEPSWAADEYASGTLGLILAPNRRTAARTTVREMHYAITENFVRQFMHFGDNSLVWLSACHSNSIYSTGFVQALIAVGAGLVVGWTNIATDGGCRAAGQAILDRLLGSNTTNPKETPPQRPFDYEAVWKDITQHGLQRHPVPPEDVAVFGPTSDIVYTPGHGTFGLLAPSIDEVLVSEYSDQAILEGLFGTPPDTVRKVTIGGVETAVDSWDDNRIVCQLARSGPGSAGDVQVIVREHSSNVRRITEWNIPMQFSFKIPTTPGPIVEGPVFLRFRADVGPHRDVAHAAPLEPLRGAIATRDSEVSLVASGSYTDPSSGCTTTWDGQQVFPAVGFGATADRTLLARFVVDTDTRMGAIGLAFAAFSPPFLILDSCGPGGAFMVSFGELYGPREFPDPVDPSLTPIPIFGVDIDFGTTDPPDYRIPAGVVEDLIDGLMRLEWTAAAPLFPPDPAAAQ